MPFLRPFAKLRNATISVVMSVSPHEIAGLLLEGLS